MDNNEILKQLSESNVYSQDAVIIIKTLYHSGIITQNVFDSLLCSIKGIIGNTGNKQLTELAFQNHQYVFELTDSEKKHRKFLIKVTAEEII